MMVKSIALSCALALSLGAVPVSATDIAPNYFMETEHSVYHPNVEFVEVTIRNCTGQETSYDLYFTLTGPEGTVQPAQPVSVPDLAALLPPEGEMKETIPLKEYSRPFPPGNYYITKSIGGEQVTAGFVIRGENCLEVEKPDSMDITLQKDGKTGAYTVKPHGTPGDLLKLWHQLLMFQKGSKPDFPGDAFASIRLNGKQDATLTLYRTEKAVWIEKEGGWYFTPFLTFAQQLELYAVKAGAFLPDTGEGLVKALNALPPFQNVRFTAHDFTTPFQLSGWQSDRKVSGVTLSIFQFPSADDVRRQMNYVYDDGYTLGLESWEGSGASQSVSFGRRRFSWAQPPHFYTAGSRLVLYNGSDQAALDALEAFLGPEVTPK